MQAEPVPEYGDGGFWYVVPTTVAVQNGEEPFVLPFDPQPVKAICWFVEYDGGVWIAIRTLAPVSGVVSETGAIFDAVLASVNGERKPYGRVNGR